MPLALLKDRTIKLTLESDYRKQQGVWGSVASITASLVKNYLPPSIPIATKLFNKATGNAFGKTLNLKGANSVSLDYSADIGEESGLFTSFLQPWYIKNVNISVKGESYLGAYSLLSSGDSDVLETLNKFKTMQNDFSTNGGVAGTRERVVVEITNNPLGSRKFIGYFKKFNFSEDVQNAYILPYQFDFIGKNIDNAQISEAKAGVGRCMNVVSGLGGMS
jgi:hypothetical protein